MGVSCSADRQALGKITAEGVFLEALERDVGQYLPDVDEEQVSPEVKACLCVFGFDFGVELAFVVCGCGCGCVVLMLLLLSCLLASVSLSMFT